MRKLLTTRPGAVLAAAAVAAVTLTACFRPDVSAAGRDRIVADHNDVREANGLGPLAVDGTATWAAQAVATRLRDRSGGRGCSLAHSDLAELASWYPGRSFAENVACSPGCGSAASVTPMFMNSPEHAAHVLDPQFTRIGVGTACNSNYLFAAVHLTT